MSLANQHTLGVRNGRTAAGTGMPPDRPLGRDSHRTMGPTAQTPPPSRLSMGLALFLLYVIWGSTYLAMRVAMEGFPPFTMAAIRFLVAGVVMLVIARARGESLPTRLQWRNALLIGGLLLACG